MCALSLWHGGKRWVGKPDVRPCRPGKYEHGPGIYLSTSLETAVKYAKGGGSTYMVELSDDLRWAEDVRVDVAEMFGFLDGRHGMRKKKEIAEDLNWSLGKTKENDGRLPASYLVNLCVNHEALSGDHGPALAEWLSEHGAQASLVKRSMEDWVVVFDPSIVIKVSKIVAAKQDWTSPDFPRVEEQLERARLLKSVVCQSSLSPD